jgi:hypothetical protein
MRAFDHALKGKYDLSDGAMESLPPHQNAAPKPKVDVVATQYRGEAPLSLWHTLPVLRTIVRFRDDVRLRRYNREWIKNNIGRISS